MRDKSSVLFFAETFYDFYKRSPPKCNISDFWLLGKISQNLYFDRLLLLKFYKILAKKVQRSYVSWYWRVVQNLKKNQFFVSKIGWILIRALKSLKKFRFDWSLLCKVYNIWPKKVQRSYISRHWRVMQNLKKNWLVVWKMRNLANFHQNTWKCQTWYFHGILLSKVGHTWAKNLQKSYVWWHWRMIKNLKKNWLVILKLT